MESLILHLLSVKGAGQQPSLLSSSGPLLVSPTLMRYKKPSEARKLWRTLDRRRSQSMRYHSSALYVLLVLKDPLQSF